MPQITLPTGETVLFDAADIKRVMRHRWRFHPPCYVITSAHRDPTLMHRMFLRAKPGQHCDHINGIGLDNRRCNLRLATPQQNAFNRGPSKGRKYKGVYRRWIYRKTKEGYPVAYRYYYAMIVIDGRQIVLKQGSPEVCARAYDDAARRLHGEFARLNFP